jgi:alpha-galactosidase
MLLRLAAFTLTVAMTPVQVPSTVDTFHDSGLSPTPYMGWNTYFGLGGDPTEAEVRSVTDSLVSSGLRDAGYEYVWIDGNWAAPVPRSGAGELTADPARFPSGMAALTRYIHAHGMKAGIYTDAGPYIEGQCGLGSYGHYEADVKRFASWGFDALKADWLCGRAGGMDPETAFRQLSAAVQHSPRPMLLNICNPVSSDWGGGPYPPENLSTWSYTYAPAIADSWRTYTDVGLVDPTPQWQYQWVLRNMDVNAYQPAATRPGHYNDPDYLVPMRPMPGGGYELTFDESKTQLGMWAMMASPLIIGSDPRALPAEMVAALRNPEIVAVDQDPLVRQGVKVADTGATTQVWSKELSGSGKRAVALLNRGDQTAQITVTFGDVSLGGSVLVRDLWARADRGRFTGSYTATVPAHGVAMLRLSGTHTVPGTDLGGSTSASPAIAGDTVYARGGDGALWTVHNGVWKRLGGQIVGPPSVNGSSVYVRGTDDAVWRYGNGTWTRLGGSVTDAPSVASDGTVAARGKDGKVVLRSASGAWSSLGAPRDWPVYGRPAIALDGTGTLHVAVRTRTEEVWTRTRTAAGVWSDWTSLGGTLSDAPTLVSAAGRVYLFALAADNRLWQRNFVDGSWGGWFQRGELRTDAFTGAVGGTGTGDGHVVIAIRGVDGHVHTIAL